jgi:hypothetical protein
MKLHFCFTLSPGCLPDLITSGFDCFLAHILLKREFQNSSQVVEFFICLNFYYYLTCFIAFYSEICVFNVLTFSLCILFFSQCHWFALSRMFSH